METVKVSAAKKAGSKQRVRKALPRPSGEFKEFDGVPLAFAKGVRATWKNAVQSVLEHYGQKGKRGLDQYELAYACQGHGLCEKISGKKGQARLTPWDTLRAQLSQDARFKWTGKKRSGRKVRVFSLARSASAMNRQTAQEKEKELCERFVSEKGLSDFARNCYFAGLPGELESFHIGDEKKAKSDVLLSLRMACGDVLEMGLSLKDPRTDRGCQVVRTWAENLFPGNEVIVECLTAWLGLGDAENQKGFAADQNGKLELRAKAWLEKAVAEPEGRVAFARAFAQAWLGKPNAAGRPESRPDFVVLSFG